MLIYTECEEIQGLEYTCNPCNSNEGGRVRSLCLIKPGTILPIPLTLQAIEFLIAQDKLWVLPETSGTFDGGTPKMGTGYGDNKERLMGNDYSLTVKDPNYISNRDFMQAVEELAEWNLAYRTETQLAVVYSACTISAKAPVEEGLDTDVVWTLEAKWFSRTKPILIDYPINLFDGIFKTNEYITGLTVQTDGRMYLEVDTDKSCKVLAPDGSIINSVGGVIDTTWGGDNGKVVLILPKNNESVSIFQSDFIGGLVVKNPLNIQASVCTSLTSLSAQNAIDVDTSDCTSLISISALNATTITTPDCPSLTILSAPSVTSANVLGCTALTTAALELWAKGVYEAGTMDGTITGNTINFSDFAGYALIDTETYGYKLINELGWAITYAV